MPGIYKTETKKIVKKYSFLWDVATHAQFHHCKDNTYIWRHQYTVQCILAIHLTKIYFVEVFNLPINGNVYLKYNAWSVYAWQDMFPASDMIIF